MPILDNFTETLPRNILLKIQTQKLKNQIKYIYENSALQHRKFDEVGIKPSDIKTLTDISKIPILDNPQIIEEINKSEDVFGGRLCCSIEGLWTIFEPQQPKAKEPIFAALKHQDREQAAMLLTRCFKMAEVPIGALTQIQVDDWEVFPKVAENWWTYGRPTPHTLLNLIINPAGLTPLDFPMNHEIIRALGVEVLFTKRKIFKAMGKEFQKEGVKPKDAIKCQIFVHRDRKGVLSAENRRDFKERWGGDHFSMLDIQENFFWAVDCSEHSGLHVYEDFYYVEACEDDGTPVGDGETGKLVITNLWVEATPLLRYKTDIEVKMIKEPCECGRTHLRIIPNKYL